MSGASTAPGRGRLHVSAAASVLAMVTQMLIGLVWYGFLIRSLGAQTVGVWVSLMAVGLLACTADMGLNHALIRQMSMARSQQSGASEGETVETLVYGAAVFTGVALCVAYLTHPAWSDWLSLAQRERADAAHWLPYLLFGLWLNRLGDAFAGALDGQQRFVERATASICALLLGLLLTVLSVPKWGMHGAALAFVAQNALLMLANLLLLRRGITDLQLLRPRLRPRILAQGVRYGLSVQALVLCYLVLESSVKLSLARNGQLAAVTYFDIAFRVGKGVRGLLAAALRVLVPRLTVSPEAAQQQAHRSMTYTRSFGVLLVVALPIFVALGTFAEPISWLLLGRVEQTFAQVLAIALLGWLLYSLTDPALNLALSSGHMRWPLRGHLLTLGLMALTANVPFVHTSVAGLCLAVMFAMLVGCAATLAGVQRAERMAWSLLQPFYTLLWVTSGVVVGVGGFWAGSLAPAVPAWTRWGVAALVVLGYVLLLWRLHPSARWLLARRRSGGKAAYVA